MSYQQCASRRRLSAPFLILSMLFSSSFLAAGCAPKKKAKTPKGGAPDERTGISGAWDWSLSLKTEKGDFRVERESWFLKQKGSKLAGHYSRTVTVVSRDGKPFECSGSLRYTLAAEFKIKGKVDGESLRIRETEVKVKPGPCEKGKRRLDSYEGRIGKGKIVLSWGEGDQALRRRDLSGVWWWSRTRTLPNGDTSVARERWHLVQKGGSLVGARYRQDIRVSNDKKRYRCNGRLRMSRYVGWKIEGKVGAEEASVEFGSPLVKASPCEARSLEQSPGKLRLAVEPYRLRVQISGAEFDLVRAGGLEPIQYGGERTVSATKKKREGLVAAAKRRDFSHRTAGR